MARGADSLARGGGGSSLYRKDYFRSAGFEHPGSGLHVFGNL